ncbi:glycosyltransferase family 2 protein [Adhaeribacter radiodurans]|uniref:Glycosyltransferase family 2 protein n=1 Tax=Adhaeribacter radiodurans TaxID=2745197 RepID=A0A7L7L4F9_9BACT|nr:glycosyltransferase family 2 protein [Adhaeribacter radiodurans]QMU27701.1 glycosyltransferase family 2 protein [Adhaeribacter radiodurans]
MLIFFTICFWLSLGILFYSYFGYGLVLFGLVKAKRIFKPTVPYFTDSEELLPDVTVVVAAYNEEDYITEKIENTLALQYPSEKLKLLVVTDGSSDQTPNLVKKYPQVTLLHQPERKGKIAAVERAMPYVSTGIVVFTDANTMLNQEAIVKLVRHYQDEKVGAVAGEKRILVKEKDAAHGAGEGIYWKYESALKKWDSELYTVVGAAGELFSIRTKLFEPVPHDTLIEDFYMTLRIAQKGHKVRYEPEAYALEGPSASVGEELKRKIRIAAGGIQAVVRLSSLLNLAKYGLLSFQYISHRVLRWTLAPLALLMLLISNIVLVKISYNPFFQLVLVLQLFFYLAALLGKICETRKLKIKAFFVPYYFLIMNYAVYLGFARFLKGSQSVLWEKAKRG